MVISSDEAQVQSFADWPMSHARRVTKDNTKNPEYHHCRCRDKDTADRLQTVKICPAEKSWPNHVICCSFLAWFGHDFSADSGFQFGLYHVVVPLSFLRSTALHHCFPQTLTLFKIFPTLFMTCSKIQCPGFRRPDSYRC